MIVKLVTPKLDKEILQFVNDELKNNIYIPGKNCMQ